MDKQHQKGNRVTQTIKHTGNNKSNHTTSNIKTTQNKPQTQTTKQQQQIPTINHHRKAISTQPN